MKNKLEWMQLSQQQSGVILDEISNKINELNLGSKFAVWISQIPIELDDLAKYSEQLLEQGKSEEEKDQLYTTAKEIWGDLAQVLKNTKYTFYLNRKQYHFLKDLLEEKLEYDVNTVFVAIELYNMLGQWKESGAKQTNDKDIVNPT